MEYCIYKQLSAQTQSECLLAKENPNIMGLIEIKLIKRQPIISSKGNALYGKKLNLVRKEMG